MIRDRLKTEQRLIDTAHELITEGGFDNLRINRLAQRSRVNKILIYRYFGGLDGLIKAYYDKYQPIVSAPPIDLDLLEGVSIDEFFAICADYVLTEFRLLRSNPQAQEVMRNNLMRGKPNTSLFDVSQKEERLRVMIEKLGELIQSSYGRSFAAIIVSGMTMLTFMAQDKRTVMGIDLDTPDGWNEIEEAIRRIFYAVALATKERLGNNSIPQAASTNG